ncbi:20S proteasome subunit A/B [Halorussus lipolyticus]|uniref:20S proteasome subunit A/B n=1 Tax=Halorussus lipolyticus TaxID=3034024 RepID=UPI0023E8CB40|nr:20S proteasome subunit A/B [Halorussus sp. DT80]
MATIVGVRTEEGAVLAGDRLLVADGTVRSEDKRHVFDLGEAGAAAVGDSGGVDEFHRRLESEVEAHEVEDDEPMGLTLLANVASDLADDEGVEAIVAGRDDGAAGIRGIGSDGSVLTDDVVVFGSGAQVVLGVLESREDGIGLDDAEELARDAVETASDRDTDTGGEVDTYRLADE